MTDEAPELARWWHGSPFEIDGDLVLPGCKVGKDRWGMGRTAAAFATTDLYTAVYYGSQHAVVGFGQDNGWAKWLYEVQPGRPNTTHMKLLDEGMFDELHIVRRYKLLRPCEDLPPYSYDWRDGGRIITPVSKYLERYTEVR